MDKEKLENAIKEFRANNKHFTIISVAATVGILSSHPKIFEIADAIDSDLTLTEATNKIISLI